MNKSTTAETDWAALESIGKAYLFCVWHLQSLQARGYVTTQGNVPTIGTKGMPLIAAMLKQGYRPDQAELERAMAFLAEAPRKQRPKRKGAAHAK